MSKYFKNWLVLGILTAIIAAYFRIEKAFSPSNQVKISRLTIVPHPQEIGFKTRQQDFVIDSNTVIIAGDNLDGSDSVACGVLNAAIEKFRLPALTYIRSKEFKGDHNAIVMGSSNKSHPLLDSLVACRAMLTTPPTMKSEEYRIDIDSNFVVLVGNDQAAIFFGVQTLIQLIEDGDKSHEGRITAVRIRDFPDMPIRSVYYGFHLKNLDNDTLIERGYRDIQQFARYKFNLIGLDNHHYSHLDMEVPDGSGKKYHERLAEIFDFARKYYLEPRVGGWPTWFGDNASKWNVDISTLESIRTTQTIVMKGTEEYPLRISSGHIAYKVIYESTLKRLGPRISLIHTN